MVLFNQKGIGEAQAMIGPAAAQDRIFQRRAQARQRFARIEQLSFGACQQVDIAADFAGHPGERLHEIECGTFAGQQDPRRAFQLE